MNERVINERAWMMAQHCVAAVANVLSHEQQLQAKECFYELCKYQLELFELEVDRLQQRLRPLNN